MSVRTSVLCGSSVSSPVNPLGLVLAGQERRYEDVKDALTRRTERGVG